jgi:tRNA pseudouridine55 synthase
MTERRHVNGVLLLDKPAGPSSNQALQRVKRLLGARKAGHAGTLDPLATGLLPILLGEATKFASYLSDATKVYEATLLLGVTTNTGDLAGEVIERHPVAVSAESVEAAAAHFRGTISQIPPMHSALKVGGKPLYELARRGEVVERQAREVHIDELTVGGVRGDEVDIRVRCSKGTYIRVLAEDLGRVLGCGATLKQLRRVQVGPFGIAHAVSLDDLEVAQVDARLHLLLPVDAGLDHIASVRLGSDAMARIRRGQDVAAGAPPVTAGTVRLYEAGCGRFAGLGELAEGVVRPLRLVSETG